MSNNNDRLQQLIAIVSLSIEEFDKGNYTKDDLLKTLLDCQAEMEKLKKETDLSALNILINKLTSL